MRKNVVFVVLIGLLALLGVSLALKHREPRVVQLPSPSASATPSASASAKTMASVAASSSGRPSGLSPAKPKPSLGRTLRVTGLGWELVAPLVLENDGVEPSKDSGLGKAGVLAAISVADDPDGVERALARGGSDDAGADVAIVPLPVLVASWEHLSALSPAVFFVTGFSKGRDVVLGKQPLDKLPASGEVLLAGGADSAATALALFVLDLAGVPPARVKLVEESDAKAVLRARRRASLKPGEQGGVLIGSAEASHFVPLVAIASASFVRAHEDTLMAWSKAWLDGQKRLAADPTAAARTISASKDAPEPITLLARLGEIGSSSLGENAELMGLSGRGAVTVDSLFQRTWRLERDAKLVTVPEPESAPVTPVIVAGLARSDKSLLTPPESKPDKRVVDEKARPLVVERISARSLDEESVSTELGFVAGVFDRAKLRMTAYRAGALDKSASEAIVHRAVERYALADQRVSIGKVGAHAGVVAAIEVLPLP